MLLKTPERGAVPELVYRYPQIAMHLPQKAVSPVQNDILKDPQVLELQCWGPADQEAPQRPTTGPHDPGSHPSLDLVSTSEVITALNRNKNRQVSQKYCTEWLHNTSFPVELDCTHPSMVPAHETSPGGEVRRVESGPSVR